MELIQRYENQIDYSRNSGYNNNEGGFFGDSENIGKSGNMDLSLHTEIKENESEIKDNFS